MRNHTSVSGLITQKIKEMVDADERYRAAMERALDAMRNAENHGGGTWTREELYDRWT